MSRRGRAHRSKLPGGLSVHINGVYRNLDRQYAGHARMRETQALVKSNVAEVLDGVFRDAMEAGKGAALIMAQEFQEFNDDLIEQTPWHEEGPTDPPLHAAEAWKNEFYPSQNGFTLAIYNPKDYMPFLEDGWSPQAPAGWMAAAWTLFSLKLEARLRG